MIQIQLIARISLIGLMVALLGAPVQSNPDQINLYVSKSGSDSWGGRLLEPNASKTDGPFRTLERARDEIRTMKEEDSFPGNGVQVIVREGIYYLDKPFELKKVDSGTETGPIVYTSFSGEDVRLVGGAPISGFKPVEEEAILKRLDEKAREHIVQADLKSQGITDLGRADQGGAELFFNDIPMTLSRWPNEGFVRIEDIVVKDGHEIHGHKGSKIGKFKYSGSRPARWIGEQDPWLHGYWFWDWSDQRQPIESINTADSIISLATPYHHYGYREGQWYYAFNMISELDSPGEWYIDRERGILYFWPPDSMDRGNAVISILPNIITLNDASYVVFRDFTLEASRGAALVASGGKGDCLSQCAIRNTGGWGASLSGAEHSVVGCDIYRTGGGGVSLSGGDRPSLTPGGLYAENNQIHHYGRINRMYTPGISISGVGNRASHNLIHTAPHIGIMFSGNDHLFEFNEIHHVCMESNDAGAMYAGRNWTMRGHKIQYNYLHDITGFENRGCVGVYLDDMFASASIFGNVFYKVTRAAFIGGGRDCSVENNIFVDCDPALHVDARALGWAGYHSDEWIKEAKEKGTLQGIAYNKPPYSERYPKLVNILEENPKAPVGNTIARNICWGGEWDDVEEKARPFLAFEKNLIDVDPLFEDAENQNFNLKSDSPAFKIGFQKIPFDQIGLRTKPAK
ncbi:MAG: right-handed parallel beta-helix repeat-containing protein [Candidatus Omnitrophica bacterium]|nr:right-handed parallel beta-helix repeat-containing protein [Candidatus Omnitrophota bacterium]